MPERRLCANRPEDVSGRPVFVYTGQSAHRRVLDVELVPPDSVWSSPGEVIWGIGDFNGDGKDDLLLGSSPGAFDSIYALVNGPLIQTPVR